MDKDLTIEFCNELYNLINNNNLPISVKYFIIKDLFNETQKTYNEYLLQYRQFSSEVREEKDDKK